MYSVVVKEKRWVGILGVFCILLFGTITVLGIVQELQKENITGLVVVAALGGALTFLGIIIFMDYLFREMALGYQGCYYRTMFGRKKVFALKDIAKIEFYREYITLLDASGGKLVRFENNMLHASEALEFIKNYHSGLEAYGQPEVVIRKKELTAKQKKKQEKNRERTQKIREKWEAVDSLWAKNRRFYECAAWIRGLRAAAWILTLGGFALACLSHRLSPVTAARLTALYPLALWGFWLAFHRVIVWGNCSFLSEDRKKYVQFPYLGFVSMLLAASNDFFYAVEYRKVLLFNLLLFLVILSVTLIVTHTPRGWLELAAPLFLLAVYILISADSWPVLLHIGEPLHIEVQMLEKEMEEHSKAQNDYYFTIKLPDQSVDTVQVSSALYRRTEKNETVVVCLNDSLLGEYYYLHDADMEWE